MKHITLIVLCFSLIVSCRTEQDETQNVQKVVYGAYKAIDEFNHDVIRAKCTNDAMIFLGGTVMTMDDFINMLKGMEGKVTMDHQLEDVRTRVEGPMAWMAMRVRDELSENEWIESAVLEKREGLWKIAFWHSTPAASEEGES